MHLTGAQSEHGYLVSKPRAWFAFTLSFLLMTFDFVDRQIVVSMFPYLKAEWALSDRELGALISIVSVTLQSAHCRCHCSLTVGAGSRALS